MINEDNEMTVLAYNQYLEDDTERNKKKYALEFEEMGDKFVKEIEIKKKIKNKKSQKLIPYILKKSGDIYDEDELISYSFEDVQEIYNKIKKENQLGIIKLIKFIFNVE